MSWKISPSIASAMLSSISPTRTPRRLAAPRNDMRGPRRHPPLWSIAARCGRRRVEDCRDRRLSPLALRRHRQGCVKRRPRYLGRGGAQQRFQLRLDRLQQLDGDGAGKMVIGGDSTGNVGGDRAKETVAEKEHERGGTVDHALRGQPAAGSEVI